MSSLYIKEKLLTIFNKCIKYRYSIKMDVELEPIILNTIVKLVF
jgi:hypothetical protein